MHRHHPILLLLLRLSAVLLTITTWSGPARADIRPGKYILTDDSGTLVIRQGEGKEQLTFAIDTVGGNCHLCGVTGVISGNTGRADPWVDDGSEPSCSIAFSAKGTAIQVQAVTEAACRNYCGARASFDGTYRLPPAACTAAARQKQRDASLRSHKAGRYSEAAQALEGLIHQCGGFMNWIEIDQVRNDLAVAQYRKGEFAQCLTTLSHTRVGHVKDQAELASGNGPVFLPPCDFDNYIAVARATWFNRALCTKAQASQP